MPAQLRIRRAHLLLAAIVLVALVFRLWGLTWGLENASISRRPHPDEWPVYWLFRWFGTTRSLNPCSASGSPCFFDWGSLYPYLAYGLHFLLSPLWAAIPLEPGRTPQLAFIHDALTGRILSAVASCLAVIAVYRLGMLAYGESAGLLAATVLAVSALAIQLAHFATPDSLVLLLLSLTLLAALSASGRPSCLRFALAGGLVGISAGAEYHMVLLAVPLLVAWLLADFRKVHWLLLSVAVGLALYLVTNPYALIDLNGFLTAQVHTLRIRTVDSAVQYQGRFDAYGPAVLYVLRYPLGYGVGFPATVWMAVAVLWAAWRRSRADLILLAWLVPYALLISLSPAKFIRYGAPLLPPLAILTGRAVFDIWTISPLRVRRIAMVLVAGSLAWTAAYDSAYAGLFSAPDARTVAAAWLRAHVAPGKQVALESLPTGLVNAPYFVVNAGYRPCFVQFDPARLDGPMQYLVTDDYSLEEHPDVSSHQVLGFRRTLQTSHHFQVIFRAESIPTFLGFRFSLAGSPHDWRYPDRVVTVYRRVGRLSGTGALCFSSLHAALSSPHTALSGGR